MNRPIYCGFLLLVSSASSVAAPNPNAPPLPLPVELELSVDAHAHETLFAVIEELALRIPLERVREPFRCTTGYTENELGQEILVSCDPTQRTASRIANYLDPTRSDLLYVEPRHCSEDCVRRPLSARRRLELRLPIRGEVTDAPCPEGGKTTLVDFRFQVHQRVGRDGNGELAKLPFLFMTSAVPSVSIPVSSREFSATKCSLDSSAAQLKVSCGEQVFVAKQVGSRLSFDDGGPRGALVLPCGKQARWPRALPPR